MPYLRYVVDCFAGRNRVVIGEIGLCHGGNFVLLGNVLKNFIPSVYGMGIDWPGQPKWGGTKKDVKITTKQLKPTFDYNIIIGDSQSDEVMKQTIALLGDEKFDLLFIDGNHSFEGCTSDYERYGPLVNSGGLIAVHDIKEYPKWKHVEVHKVWPKIKERKQFVEFSSNKNYGIGVIVK